MTRALLSSTLARFLLVGGVSYLVNQAALFGLYEYGLAGLQRRTSTPEGMLDTRLLVASVLALELSIVVRFALNDRWTFRDRAGKPFVRRFYESNLTSIASPLISLAAVNLLTPLLGISYLVSNSVGIALGLAWNWGWSNHVVWSARPPSATLVSNR